jgi:hypothetical protein
LGVGIRVPASLRGAARLVKIVDPPGIIGAKLPGRASESLARAFRLYARELRYLCKRHGADVSDFAHLSARFSGRPRFERFTVTVEDRNGRRSTDEYVGVPGSGREFWIT